MINVIIVKPTKECNADCSYCSSPPDGVEAWDIDSFKVIFDRLSDNLSDEVEIIWHGGEPMLMGPDFYIDTYNYAKSVKPGVKFSIQTNLLLYKKSRWKKVFEDIFQGNISTSFEPDNNNRTIKGNAQKYTDRFMDVIEEVVEDGFTPLVIGTYSKETSHYVDEMYTMAKRYDTDEATGGFHLRVNYVTPTGRYTNDGISPRDYGDLLIELYDRWIVEVPKFDVVPLSEMFERTIGKTKVNKCPWTNKCGGTFLAIEPNGDMFNCSEFADIGDKSFSFGNVLKGVLYGTKRENLVGFERQPTKDKGYGVQVMETPAARAHIRREHNLPMDCRTCEHFRECEGGCHRDSVLLDTGISGKYFYCLSWKKVFGRIKESVLNGEADNMIRAFDMDPEEARQYIRTNENIIGVFK